MPRTYLRGVFYLGLRQGFDEGRVVEDVSFALAQQLEDLTLNAVQLDVHRRPVDHQLFLLKSNTSRLVYNGNVGKQKHENLVLQRTL